MSIFTALQLANIEEVVPLTRVAVGWCTSAGPAGDLRLS